MKATIKEGCLTHWFSYTFLYSHVPFPSISIHFLNFVEDCLGYAAMLKISTFNPPSPSRSSWKHTMRREGMPLRKSDSFQKANMKTEGCNGAVVDMT